MVEDKTLLSYYASELSYLRQAGKAFGQQYPQVAKRLDFHEGESTDPHTERLLESFAFLTARLQKELDDQFPRLTSALLQILNPQLVNPIPSMAIAHFVTDPKKGKMTDGYVISKETPLMSLSDEGLSCRFRTCYDLTLFPITLESVSLAKGDDLGIPSEFLNSPHLLRFRLTSQGVPFSALDLKDLTFYLNGSPDEVNVLLEAVLSAEAPVFVSPNGGTDVSFVSRDALKIKGFKESEHLLPPHHNSLHGYQLLQEFFFFPQKFRFLEFSLPSLGGFEDTLDIYVSIPSARSLSAEVLMANKFLLGCTPIVNLFNRISEPMRLDHFSTEYRLIPDARRERITEIYDIRDVRSTSEAIAETRYYSPYYSATHETSNNNTFWLGRRAESTMPNVAGTDLFLSFVDLGFRPTRPMDETLFALLTCTNRQLAGQLPPGAPLQAEKALPVSSITCLDRPTLQIPTPQSHDTSWQLISTLSRNALSLQGGGESGAPFPLKEMLYLHARQVPASILLEGLRELSSQKIVRRFGDHAWKGFSQGLEVTLTLEERDFGSSSPLLFGKILHTFFEEYVSHMSFVETVLLSTRREGEWRRWAPQRHLKSLS